MKGQVGKTKQNNSVACDTLVVKSELLNFESASLVFLNYSRSVILNQKRSEKLKEISED